MPILRAPPAIIAPAEVEELPTVVEIIGGPEYFVDGRLTRDRGETITTIFYVERNFGGEIANHEVFRVHYAKGVWLASLDRTLRMLRAAVH